LGKAEVSQYHIPIYFYKNTAALPRFYYARKTVSAKGKSLVEMMKEGKTDFKNITYLDCRECGGGEISSGAPTLRLAVAKNGFLKIETKSQKEEWLIVSESYLPGWKAELDGKSAEIILANGLYMAIRAPAGEHEITLKYDGILGEGKALKILRFMN
jgi:hypothetical protein